MSTSQDQAAQAHRASLERARGFPLAGDFHPTAYVAPNAVVVGSVRLAARSSIWFGAVLRADMERIEIGEESNVQDNSVFHVDLGYPALLGRRVVVGHRAVVHGAVVEDGSLIGMGAVLLNGAHIGSGSLVAAGAVVGEGRQIPPGSLVVGVPGRVVGAVSQEQAERIRWGAEHYVALAERYRRLGIVAAPPGAERPAFLAGGMPARPAGRGDAAPAGGAVAGPPGPRLRVSLLTASDTRSPASDESGRVLAEGFTAAGHQIVERRLATDDPDSLRVALAALLAGDPDAVVVTGGSGIAPRDHAPEVVASLLERPLPGFGELFRSLSHAAVGTRALASRALAGRTGQSLVFLLPGSPRACRLALEEILLPELPHLVAMTRGAPHGEEAGPAGPGC
jgi:molybdenum cofactor synthesis domain-containing protein